MFRSWVQVSALGFALTWCSVSSAFDPMQAARNAAQATRDGLSKIGEKFGGAGCQQFFDGKSKAMATQICAAAGSWAGARLRQFLNDREQAQLAEATFKTMDTRKRETVTTETGTKITTEIVPAKPTTKQEAPAPAKAPAAQAASAPTAQSPAAASAATAKQGDAECRTVRQTIVLKNGDRHEEDLTACKKDGKWVPQPKS